MRLISQIVFATLALLVAGCSKSETVDASDASEVPADDTTQEGPAEEAEDKALDSDVAELKEAADAALARLVKSDEGVQVYIDKSAGYAVYPKITKGGLIIGGAHGKGLVYEGGVVIGKTNVKQGSIGLIAGGQTFSEVIFFEDSAALERFKKGEVKLNAKAQGVAGTAGASVSAKYAEGVAVFVFGQEGLMGDASVGGQGFAYEALD